MVACYGCDCDNTIEGGMKVGTSMGLNCVGINSITDDNYVIDLSTKNVLQFYVCQ